MKVSVITCAFEDELTVHGIYKNESRARYEFFMLLESVLEEEAPTELALLKKNFGSYYTPILCGKLEELFYELASPESSMPQYELHEGIEIL